MEVHALSKGDRRTGLSELPACACLDENRGCRLVRARREVAAAYILKPAGEGLAGAAGVVGDGEAALRNATPA